MKTFAIVLAAASMMGFAAHAQAPAAPMAGEKSPSTVDPSAKPTGTEKPQSPGTTGGMQNTVPGGVATSAQDVKAQQEGKPTANETAKGTAPAGAPAGKASEMSPGTVGAAPGSTAPMPAEKK